MKKSKCCICCDDKGNCAFADCHCNEGKDEVIAVTKDLVASLREKSNGFDATPKKKPSEMNPYYTPQGIAEDKILERFRNEGVFDPPESSRFGGVMQSIHFDRAIIALVKLHNENMHDPHYMQRLLLEAAIQNIV